MRPRTVDGARTGAAADLAWLPDAEALRSVPQERTNVGTAPERLASDVGRYEFHARIWAPT
jgi:hypothetical protein